MLQFEEALARILAALPPPVSEGIPLREACGRLLSERIPAPLDLPPFDNSSVDGYAARGADVAAASPASPVCLHLAGRVAAGESFTGEVAAGACVRLFTGSALPRGADVVIMQEDTRLDANRPNEVFILAPAKPWENVRFRGEDVKRGATLAEAGEVLTPGRLALLAAVGLARVQAGCRPIVGLLATGSELKDSGAPLAPGQIYESSRAGLAPLVQRAGAIATIFPLVPDALDLTLAALQRAIEECDILVTCGGVSVGEMDYVKTAFEQLGGNLEFWKVAIKPGRPFVFGRRGDKFLFGLPGNPVSALVTFLLLVRPALLRWQGAAGITLPACPGILAEPLANTGTHRHFMRVAMDAAGHVRSAGIQASHILSSFASANGLVEVPPKTTLAAGKTVSVLRWE